MCARELPAACQAAEGEGGGARSPLKVSQLQTLREAFGQVPDPRSAASRRQPLAALLGLVALGLLMGARDVLDSVMNLPRGEIVNRGALLREVETDIAALLEAVNELEAKGTPRALRRRAREDAGAKGTGADTGRSQAEEAVGW